MGRLESSQKMSLDTSPEEYEGEGSMYQVIDDYNEWVSREKDKKAYRYTFFDQQHGIIQADKRKELEEALLRYNAILNPYYQRAAHSSTRATISDKMKRKLMPWVERTNQCLVKANDITDSNTCMDW